MKSLKNFNKINSSLFGLFLLFPVYAPASLNIGEPTKAPFNLSISEKQQNTKPPYVTSRKRNKENTKSPLPDQKKRGGTDNQGNTDLHLALLEGDTKKALRLMEEGANIRAINKAGKSLLHIASEKGNTTFLRALFELGEKALLEIRDKNGRTALHLASFNGQTSAMEILLKEGADVQAKDKWGNSPAHETVVKGQIPALGLLFAYGADINAVNNKDDTLLHSAILKKNKDMINFLMEKSANPNIQDKWGNTSLHSAVYSEDIDILNAVLSSEIVELDMLNNMRLTALHIAVDLKNKDIALALIKKGADPNIEDEWSNTSLHTVVYSEDIDMFNIILSSDIIKLDVTNKDGSTPLHFAVGLEKPDMVSALLKKGANPGIQNNENRNAIDIARGKGYKHILEIFSSYSCIDSFNL